MGSRSIYLGDSCPEPHSDKLGRLLAAADLHNRPPGQLQGYQGRWRERVQLLTVQEARSLKQLHFVPGSSQAPTGNILQSGRPEFWTGVLKSD